MTGQAERLRRARIAAGFKSASESARAFGWGDAGYRHHENGTRPISAGAASRYAKSFGVSEEWLLFGRGREASDQVALAVELFNRIPEARREEALAILQVLQGDESGLDVGPMT